jgi:hypothetical protein
VDERTPLEINQSIEDQGRIVAHALTRLNALLAASEDEAVEELPTPSEVA